MNAWQAHYHLLSATGEELKQTLRTQHAPPKLIQYLEDLLADWGDHQAVQCSLELLTQEADKWNRQGSLGLRAFIQTTQAWLADIQGGSHV